MKLDEVTSKPLTSRATMLKHKKKLKKTSAKGTDGCDLAEEALSYSNMQRHAGQKAENLTSTDEYKLLAQQNADYGKKLVDAWVGDAKEAARNGKDFLFPRLVTEQGAKKVVPGMQVSPNMVKAMGKLSGLHQVSFSGKSGYKPSTDQRYGHERYAKEQGFSSR